MNRLRGSLERHRLARLRLRSRLADFAPGVDADLALLDAIEAEFGETEFPAIASNPPQLLQSQKLEAIGELTGGIAHDFNNILTSVIAGLQLLARAGGESRRAHLIRRIEEAAWRGADLNRRLLAFARRQPLTPRALDLGPAIGSMRELLRHGLSEDIRIVTDTPAELWPVSADLAALEVAVLNLAVNGRDAMPDGGTIVLGARNADPATLADVALPPGEYVRLFVSDTGTGMAVEVIARAFEPFFTTKPQGKGTGLGLAQVYGFACQSGGTATVESVAGQGTTVSIFLPRAEQPPAPLEPSSHRVTHPSDAGLAVLLVEDDDAVAEATLGMLDQLGHRGVRVSSLPAAVAVLAGSDCVDVLFTDLLLGQAGNGLDLAREAERRNPRIPIVLTSGYGDAVTGRLAAAQLPFLRKPYTLEALRNTLDSVRTVGSAR